MPETTNDQILYEKISRPNGQATYRRFGDAAITAELKDFQEQSRAKLEEKFGETSPELEAAVEKAQEFFDELDLTTKPVIAIDSARLLSEEPDNRFATAFQNESILGFYDTVIQSVVIAHDRLKPNDLPRMEHTVVHELAHSSGHSAVLLKSEEGNENKKTIAIARTGYGVVRNEDTVDAFFGQHRGNYLEEGFADLLASHYLQQHGKASQTIPKGTQPHLPLPSKYVSEHSHNAAAYAAVGLELLIAQDPSLLDSLIEGRRSIQGLRDVARKIDAIEPGLYKSLSYPEKDNLPYVLATTKYILDSQFNGDSTAFDRASKIVEDELQKILKKSKA